MKSNAQSPIIEVIYQSPEVTFSWKRLARLSAYWVAVWAGLWLMVFSLWQAIQQYVEAKENTAILAERKVSEVTDWKVLHKIPLEIEIPDVNVSVAVVPGQVTNGEWEVSETDANYLIGSGVIGEPGNVVIYAHKRPHLFANLPKLEIGAKIRVTSRDMVTVYEVTEKKVVLPTDVSVLEPTENETLTLYTCDGWQDQQRYVVKAKLVSTHENGLGGIIAVSEMGE